jgi:hypothetical protein
MLGVSFNRADRPRIPEARRPGSTRGRSSGPGGRPRPARAADRRGEPGDPRPMGSGVDLRSAGGRKEHLVDDMHDAVARLDVGLDDRDGVAAGVGQRDASVAHADG